MRNSLRFVVLAIALLGGAPALIGQNLVPDANEKAALMAIYNSTDGAHWNAGQRWPITRINSFPDSALYGVQVVNGDIQTLTLVNNNLTGALPSEINYLTQLQTLELALNHLSDTLPSFSGLVNLVTLNLATNNFTGNFPSSVCSLTHLTTLSFSGSILAGPIPSTISQLTSLQYLSLNNIDLSMSGAIPSTLSSLDNLQTLNMEFCQLVPASVPAGFTGMNSLTTLDLTGNNNFKETDGTFADLIFDLPSLQILVLKNEDLHLLPASFNELTQLRYLDLTNNDFSDTVRLGNIIDTLQTIPSLRTLFLKNCQIESLPPNFDHLAGLTTLYINNNTLIPANCTQIGSIASLAELHLDNDQLTDLPSTLVNLTALKTLDISHNSLSPVTTVIQNIPALETLNLSFNGLSSLPSWFGSGNMTSIKNLYLDNNALTLPLNSSFSSLANLVTLSVSSNSLNGVVPSYFGSFTSLVTLNLNNNVLSSPLPDLSPLTHLENISINHNQFSGSVPVTVSNIPISKSLVDISFNHFDSLPSFHSDGNLTVILNNNKLSFANILRVMRPVRKYVYAPQDTLAMADSLLLVNGYVGDSLILTAPVDTTNSSTVYQWWYVNSAGQTVPVGAPSTNGVYVNPDFAPSDSGYYYNTSTNPALPGLTQVSPKYHVKIALCRADIGTKYTYSRYVCAFNFLPPKDTRNCKAQTFHWNFGDGKHSYDKAPFHAFSASGTYSVSLTIHYRCGIQCQPDTTVTRQIIFNEAEPFNAFTAATVPVPTNDVVKVINTTTSTFSDSWPLQSNDPTSASANGYLNGSQGVWRNEGSFVYKVPRSQSEHIDVRNDGSYTLKMFNWQQAELNAVPNWIRTNTVTQYSGLSYELENQDVMGIYTAALYDYGGHLPSANGTNTRNDEMGFTGFEYLKGNSTGNLIFGTHSISTTKVYDVKSGYGNMAIVGTPVSDLKNVRAATVYGTNVTQVPFFSGKQKYLYNDSIVCIQQYTANPKWTAIVFKQPPLTTSWLGRIVVNGTLIPAIVANIDTLYGHTGKSSLKISAAQTFPQHLLQLDSAKRYLVSGWVSVHNANLLTPHLADNLGIDVVIKNRLGLIVDNISFTPSGPVIEGWQQVQGTFICPVDDALISFAFNPGSTGHAWYDDLRIHPEKGNMKSYVYDLNDYHLTATLDEDNFASLYFYDKEGNLYLVKKETERGMKTISENVSYIVEKRN